MPLPTTSPASGERAHVLAFLAGLGFATVGPGVLVLAGSPRLGGVVLVAALGGAGLLRVLAPRSWRSRLAGGLVVAAILSVFLLSWLDEALQGLGLPSGASWVLVPTSLGVAGLVDGQPPFVGNDRPTT